MLVHRITFINKYFDTIKSGINQRKIDAYQVIADKINKMQAVFIFINYYNISLYINGF